MQLTESQVLALAPDSAAPPFAPEGVPPQVLASAQELATAEQRLTQRLSDPLWHAVDALLLQTPPATRTLARLWAKTISLRFRSATGNMAFSTSGRRS